jgi:KipI family sensor histidine kinase inhibitor
VLLDLAGSGDPVGAGETRTGHPGTGEPGTGEPGTGEPSTSAAARLAAAVSAAGLPGVLDVIPGACTVLVTVEPGTWDGDDLAARLLDVRLPARESAVAAPVTEIAVCYDGPDLAEVAALTGLPVGEVIARHQAADYRVGWLGFLPGFGYLTGLDPALRQVPRLDTPRLAVPAGSVAIAGGLAAVYPAGSPGGWRLLGRTDIRMWDPERAPPALLAPGMRVRFRAVAELAAAEAGAAGQRGAPRPRTDDGPGPARTVQVLQPGPLTTIQDLGRPGFGHLGVPRSGAADIGSLRLANALVGNGPGAAGLEATLGRLGLRFGCDAVAAITGAPARVRISGPDGTAHEPAPETAFAVPAGSVLRLGSPGTGLRSYLAVDGGIDVAPDVGSRSADLLSGLGPAPLRAGELLRLGERGAAGLGQPGRTADGTALPIPRGQAELRVIAGPRQDWFTPGALEALTSGSYQVTAASNRTGLRLAGPPLRRRQVAELPSEGMAAGSLQVAHDGQPILLLADHPTTGGYPVIAVVRAVDVDLAAQLRPGQQVRFRLSPRAAGSR